MMQTNPTFFVNIDLYIDVLSMYVLLKNREYFGK